MRTQSAGLIGLEGRQVQDRASTTRIVGGVAVIYATSVIVQNAMLMSGVAQLLGPWRRHRGAHLRRSSW